MTSTAAASASLQETPSVGAQPAPETEVELFSLAGLDGHLREVNASFAHLLGLRHEDIEGRSLLELVHPDDLPHIVEGLAALESGAQEVILENRFLVQDGSTVHLQWVARPVPNSDLWWAAGRDVTKFHEAVAQTMDLRARLDLAFGGAAACIWELDLRTRQFTWEAEAVELLSVDGRDLPRTLDDLAFLIYPDDRADLAAAFETLRQSAGTAKVGFRTGQDPAMRYFSIRAKVITQDRRGRARRAVGILIDVTAERAMEEQMLRMVMTDALTGIPNRRAFDQALRNEVRRCTRSAVPVSVLMVDVDSFKQFNDTYGHLVGDDALCAVGRALQGQVVRAGDMLARFGGEEFSVVLPGIDRQGAVAVADRLVEAVGNIHVRQAAAWQLTVSIGTATWNPGDAPLRPVDLMTRADRALYVAKAAGKNQSASDAEVEQDC